MMLPVLEELSGILRASDSYRGLLGGVRQARGLPVPAASWVLELLAADLERRSLVVVPHESDALAWVEAAELFGGFATFFSVPGLSPYQETETSLRVRSQEARVLAGVSAGSVGTLVCTPRALFRRLPSADSFRRATVRLRRDTDVSPEALAEHLLNHGYERRDLVTEVGEFAARGGVFDVFPAGEASPVRLDLFGDTVESIRLVQCARDPAFVEGESRRRSSVLPLTLFEAGRGARRPSGSPTRSELARLAHGEPASTCLALIEAAPRARVAFAGLGELPAATRAADHTESLARAAARPDRMVVYRPDEVRVEETAHRARSDSDARRVRCAAATRGRPASGRARRVGAGARRRGVRDSADGGRLTASEACSAAAPPAPTSRARSDRDASRGSCRAFRARSRPRRARGEELVLVMLHATEHRGRLEELCES